MVTDSMEKASSWLRMTENINEQNTKKHLWKNNRQKKNTSQQPIMGFNSQGALQSLHSFY